MTRTAYQIISLLLIAYGIIISTRKKFIVSGMVEQSFILVMLTINSVNTGIERKDMGFAIAFPLILAVVFALLVHGKYTVYNVTGHEIESLIDKILCEKDIGHEIHKDSIWLKDCGDEIPIHASFNTVEINLRQVRKTDVYAVIRDGIKSRLGKIEEKHFSFSSIMYIALGVIFFIILLKGR